jgi:hypothetical protein
MRTKRKRKMTAKMTTRAEAVKKTARAEDGG